MTLKEMVGKYDINVKIGCKNGNAFVYCGNLNSLDIRQKDLDLINNLTMMINNYEADLRSIKNKLKNPKIEYPKYVQRMKDRGDNFYEYEDWLIHLHERKIKFEEGKKLTLTRILNYKTIEDREVLETYKSQTEPNTGIIIIEGDDIGKSWTTDEYMKGVKNGNI